MRAFRCNAILTLAFFSAQAEAFTFFWRFRFAIRSEKSWWSWAWGAESTVSVVDRSPVVSFPSRPAAFGADISSPILGYVIPLSSFTEPCAGNDSLTEPASNYGCPPLCAIDGHEPERSETWIALVQRGHCEFVSKVREAQRLGARAVVVGGSNPETSGLPDSLINMYSPDDSSDVNISATFIKYSDYVHLSDLIEASDTSHSGLKTLSLLITAEYSTWEWYSPIITFVIILLLPSTLTLITLLIHRVRASQAAQRDRAPEDVVRSLPWQVWTGKGWEKHGGGEPVPSPDADVEASLPRTEDRPEHNLPAKTDMEDDEIADALESGRQSRNASTSRSPPQHQQPWFEAQKDCAICLCEFAKGDRVRVLPCRHIFHLDEVDEWLIQRKKLCPVCKADVTQAHPNPSTPTEEPSDVRFDSTHQSEPESLRTPPNERTPLLRSDDRHNSYSLSPLDP